MKRIDEMTIEEQKRLVRWGIISVVCMFVLGIICLWLLEAYLSSALNLKPGSMSLLAGCRVLLVVSLVIFFFPGAILCELADSRVNRRSFRMRNILIFFLFFGEAILTAATLLTLFDVFFSESSFLIQIPLVGISLSIPSLVVVGTFRVKKIHSRIKKAFE
jgi:cation transport ATPase